MVGLLFGGTFRADVRKPMHPDNDRLIFSKGHAAPLLYALYAAAGRVSAKEMLRLRTFGSRLEGHPMPNFPYTEAPTGSLGQGLAIGVGMAVAARMDHRHYRTYVLLGDSEMAEGSVWEALQLAGHERLATLTGILDVNRLGQSGPTMLGHNLAAYDRRVRSFGWRTAVIDGHNFGQILPALKGAASERRRPVMVIAKTLKGKGISFIENRTGWHGRALPRKLLSEAVAGLGPVDERLRGAVAAVRTAKGLALLRRPARPMMPRRLGANVSVREAFGQALVRLAPTYPALAVLDGEVKNSTFTEFFAHHQPQRFIEAYVAEQALAGLAAGLAARGRLPVAATFAAFWTRAHDQLRMAQYAGTHQVFVGTHAGVATGEDGASQMGLEDLALFRSLLGSTVFAAADATAADRLTEQALKGSGLVYVRLTRPAVPVLYPAVTRFVSGGSQVLRRNRRDRATIVACGTTVHEALAVADVLAAKRVPVRVIDCYSIKPIDAATLRRAARETRRLIVVEDHVAEGGLADAVRAALGPLAGCVTSLAVRTIPRSGPGNRLLRFERIDRQAILRTLLGR